MKIINAMAEILTPDITRREEIDAMYQRIEGAGRTCYKSESYISPESARRFVTNLIQRGHEAMIEHAYMAVRFTVDRGVSHELVRHRVASFAQESTRYCNYSKDKFGNELTFINPCFWSDDYPSNTWALMNQWKIDMEHAEEAYMRMIRMGASPQEARTVLPNSIKTEVVMTANMREWRHFFRLRAACETGPAHPQMLEVSVPLFQTCAANMPELFGDIVIPDDVMEKYRKRLEEILPGTAKVQDQVPGQITMEELMNK